MKDTRSKPVKLKIDSRHHEALKNAHAYVFENATGKLLESKPISKGEATLETPVALMRGQVQLIIGPPMPKELAQNVSAGMLKNAGGFQTSTIISPEHTIDVTAIPHIDWPIFWPWCHITGNLTKSFIIDGVEKILPVCDARVHVCDIDPIIIWWNHIPDWVFIDLATKLRPHIDWPKERIPIPIPNPNPPDPPFLSGVPGIRMAKVMSSTTGNAKTIALPTLPAKVQTAIISDSLSAIKSSVLEHFTDLHPYFCLWPWFWPWFYRCTELGVAESDCNGHFDFSFWDFGGKNIYVWVEVLIDGNWVTVYRPFKPCHTWWNYPCGTDINIRIYDDRVRPCSCDPLPGDVIWMKSINFGASIRGIQQSHAASGHLADAVGLTQYGGYGNISPFGSTFPLVVQFGAGFPNAAASHYRWRFKRIFDGNLNPIADGDHNLSGDIAKHYTYPIVVAGHTQFASNNFPMGAAMVGGNAQYKIPHTDAVLDVPEPGAEWERQDTATIYLNTTGLSMEGLYELTFELVNAAGVVQAIPADTYVVSKKPSDIVLDPSQETVTADGLPEHYVVKNGAGLAIAFRFYMRIDNNHCYADVQDAIVPSGTTDTVCGFGYYNDKATDNVTLRFVAGHPHDFATYSFNVTKGNSNPVIEGNSAGAVTIGNNFYTVGNSPMGASPLDAYSKVIPVGTMLGTCPQAAFAETLHVDATHTDGVNSLDYLDAGDTAAIAIAPLP